MSNEEKEAIDEICNQAADRIAELEKQLLEKDKEMEQLIEIHHAQDDDLAQQHAGLNNRILELEKERDRLKIWQDSALEVLESWGKVRDWITENNKASLGDTYSVKALECLIEFQKELDTSEKALQEINRQHQEDYKRLKESETLLRELTDLQNGPPLPTYRKNWTECMEKINEHFFKSENV